MGSAQPIKTKSGNAVYDANHPYASVQAANQAFFDTYGKSTGKTRDLVAQNFAKQQASAPSQPGAPGGGSPVTLPATPGVDPTNPNNLATTVEEKNSADLHDRYTSGQAMDNIRNERSSDITSILANAMSQSNGLNSSENNALRTNALSSITAQNDTAMRALRGQQASSGLRGGAAGAQMANQRAQATNAVGTAERGLVADNIAAKQKGLQNAATIVTGQENVERDLAANKLSTILGMRAQDFALKGASMQAQAAAASGQRGGKK